MALPLTSRSRPAAAGAAVESNPEVFREVRLVERAQAGDQKAFEELVRLSADRLYAVVLRFVADADEAEEVTQEAFLRAWRSIGRFRGRSRFSTWLYRIAINEAKRRGARRSARPQEVPLDDHSVEERPGGEAASGHRADMADTRRILEDGLRRLPASYRVAVVLRDVEGLSTREAATVMGIKERAFKSRLHRARMSLRANVEAELDV